MLKKIKHILEFIFFISFTKLFQILPYRISSFCGGFITKNIRFLFKANRRARKNIKKSFPKFSEKKINHILKKTWENIGRHFAEFTHLYKIPEEKFFDLVTVRGEENVKEFFENNKPFILISAHFGNWNVIQRYLHFKKAKTNMIYRPLNNPLIESWVFNFQCSEYFLLCAKGPVGATQVIRGLKENKIFALFIDQKLKEGIDVEFLGRTAKTTKLPAAATMKYDIPIIPFHAERKGTNFELIIEKPINAKKEKLDSEYKVMKRLNEVIEKWIKNKPEEWFWLHNRW